MGSRLKTGLTVLTVPLLLSSLALVLSGVPASRAADSKPKGGKEMCLVCHEDLSADLEGRVVHGPVEADSCTDCHNPHASRQGHLLQDETERLCASCHEDVHAETAEAFPHAALRDDRSCLACHSPHSSAHGGLLRESSEVLCTSCHESVTAQIESEHPHAPVALGECGSCHEPHGGPRAALLSADSPALCWDCHDEDAALRARHGGFSLAEADCRSCHDPHGGEGAQLVRTATHAPFADEACDTCHASESDPAQLNDQQPDLCVICHDDRDPATHADGSHPVGTDVACTDCHSPHAGEQPGNLRGAQRGLCLSCHEDIRNAVQNLESHHPTSADGGRCTACHQAHDTATQPLLARDRATLCADCHRDHSRFVHPMGPNVQDPSRPGMSVDCLSCHEPHASDQKMMLRASAERDLCVRCHAQPN